MKGAQQKSLVEDVEWNFAKERVPDSEVVACCFWEYARESGFLRDLRRRSWEYWKPLYAKGNWWNEPAEKQLHRDIQKVQSIGYAAEVILRGMSCLPDGVLPDAPRLNPGEVHRVTGSFPRPWQKLTAEERSYRSHIGSDVERIPLVAFQRGMTLDAKDIIESVESRRSIRDAEVERVKRENPHLTEDALYRTGKVKAREILPSLLWASGAERTVVSIQWAQFTDDEIASYFRKWVKANRPKDIPAPDGKGKKLNDWRVALNRLGVMRVLHTLTFADNRFPGPLKDRGEKHCYAARKLAFQKFRELLPFLQKRDKPLSWPTRGGRSNP